MRILKVTQTYYPFLEKGGPTVKVRAIARALAGRGYDVSILTADMGLKEKGFLSAAVHSQWGWQADEDGVEALYLRALARYRALTVSPSVIAFCRQRLANFDLVHIYGLYDLLGPMVASTCRRLGIPYVVEPMGMFRAIVRNVWLKRLYLRLLGQRMIGGANRIIATSEQERQELIEDGVPPAKVVVRRNGIELPASLPARGTFRRKWQIAPDAQLILFLGRLVAKKSPELMLEAFAGWRARGNASRPGLLVLAGPDEGDGYRLRLERFAARLGLHSAVLFTGPLYEESKWAAYRDADVFVLPSQSENFGNAAAEAIACGTPVIVSDRCGIAPLVDQRAGLVVPLDREALRASLDRVLSDDALRDHLRFGCADVAASLTWDEPLAIMEALYRDLIKDSLPDSVVARQAG